MKLLEGRVVLVTGAGGGLGASIMRVFAGMGASVFGCARRPDAGEAIAASIREQGLDATFVPADVTSEDDRARLVERCVAEKGKIDVLLNNAGTRGEFMSLEEMTLDEWNRVIALNLTSVFGMCQQVLPHMRKQRDGVILNISSNASLIAMAEMSAYCGSKAGLNQFTKVVAVEGFKHNIRANAILLGGTRSEMSDSMSSPENLEKDRKRRMDPDEVAQALAALCSPYARLITAAEIVLDEAVSAGRVLSTLTHNARKAQGLA
ncbi:SDR family NAD(P)-dependent oxidoreductase [Rhizorhapis sp. SPR117]|uniref:SDR family NAD(P)-dependent oxidoreductase n=1 Tax=Rhizorhapis sp. SPR117 TaxID=2912611 RepID=UPI001F2541F1|nr:SDR family oxidoreductase [Rhizorhapis sp. SPR117]